MRTHNNVLIVDVKKRKAAEIAEVEFDVSDPESRKWYESMTVV